jgi:2-polyprenyl-3-methyl-5-hydroxy-6-metoxy-1,4-benzoquinol methylase
MTEASVAYECVGLEPSAIAADVARGRGFQVFEQTFEEAEIEPGSFDVVTLDAVIEHVKSPTEVLTKVNSILRMNGVVALTTPRFGGLAYRIHRGGWNGFRHGYHTYLFSGNTLGRYLEKTGFQIARRPKRDRPLDDQLILWGIKVREAAGTASKPLRRSA